VITYPSIYLSVYILSAVQISIDAVSWCLCVCRDSLYDNIHGCSCVLFAASRPLSMHKCDYISIHLYAYLGGAGI
jgi:hypothetical protein